LPKIEKEVEIKDPGMVIPPKTPPAPHHSESPDKTLFPPGNRPPSRSIDTSNTPTNLRARTPMAPHQFDSPEKTIRPLKDNRLPRLQRTGRAPEEFVIVGKMVLPCDGLFFDENSAVALYVWIALR
jgi:hypothetical protein